jgi:malonyl CoA-acyl carrier protein transacylase/NADPH:quinone reductase-like Zn-dependent oxidoreductase
VFVFGGQGPQWWAMGRQLLEGEPAFRESLEATAAALAPHVPWSLLDELARDEGTSRVRETEVAQPALFAVQAALAAVWKRYGVEPSVVIGHSVGEIAAAHVAGALTLEDAALIAALRGRVMQAATGKGRMAMVELDAADAARACAGFEDAVRVGAINGPRSTVLSGDPAPLERIVAALQGRGVDVVWLPVTYAFHSPQMEALRAPLLAALQAVAPMAPSIPLLSTMTGGVARPGAYDARYWAEQVAAPVLFGAAVEAALDAGHRTFLEVGPHPVLAAPLKQSFASRGVDAVALPSMRRQAEERDVLLSSLGALFTRGSKVSSTQLFVPAASDDARAACATLERLSQEAPAARVATVVRDDDARTQAVASLQDKPFYFAPRSRGVVALPLERTTPGPGQVEVRVLAAGVSGDDARRARGVLEGPLGDDCVGEIVEVGPDVDLRRIGEIVVALAPGALRSHVTVDATLAVEKPADLEDDAAATLGLAACAALHAVRRLSGARRGDRVLLVGAGAFSLAALQLALARGLDVTALAEHDAQRALFAGARTTSREALGALPPFRAVLGPLRALAGIDLAQHVVVGGAVVDVGGHGLRACLAATPHPAGRTYHALDLRLSPLRASLLGRVRRAVEAGMLAPVPWKCFEADEIAAAVRELRGAGHVGKLVVRMPR